MIDVMKMSFSKEDLLKMTKEERGLVFLLGYASNQVNVLWKLIIMATNRNPTDPIDSKVSAAQTQILVRLMIGLLWEAWRLVEARLLSSPIGREYVPLLDIPAGEALDRLKKRFGNANIISTIRTNYAFHHPETDDFEAAFQQAALDNSDDADWNVYMSRTLLNCFFFGSDFVVSHGIAKALGETDVLEAHKQLLPELGPLSNDLSELTFGVFAAALRKHVGEELTLTVVAKLADAPNIDDVRIPFYIETPATGAMPTLAV
jgi:hypothetical protein